MASGQPPGTDPLKPWNQTDGASAPSARDVQHRGMPVLTDEERQIMKECERDSFYQRGLPLSAGCMVGAHMLVKSGRWAAHPRFGSLPKAIILGGIGYFAGKISYLPVCQQKILDRIPNSNLAAAIRKSRGMPEQEPQVAAAWEDVQSSSKSEKKFKDDYTVPAGLDDRFRPSVDREVKAEEPPQEKSSITYEELRRRNRQEYEDSAAKQPTRPPGSPSYKDSPLMPQKPWPEGGDKSRSSTKSEEYDSSLDSPPPPPPSQTPPRKKRTNMWGDVIEE